MNKLKKITTTLSASFESIVNEFENQEAIVKSVIAEIKNSRATLEAQKRKIENQNYRSNKRIEEIKKEIPLWIKRIKENHIKNPELAKDCSKKIIYLENEEKKLKLIISKNNKLEALLEKEKIKIESRLIEVENKLEQLKLKEVKSNYINQAGTGTTENLDEVLDRWEEKISKAEYINQEIRPESDGLSEYFETQEFEVQVENKLASILNK